MEISNPVITVTCDSFVQGHDKCYAPGCIPLPCTPLVFLYKWICRRCGDRGTDRKQAPQDNEYDRLCKEFERRKDMGTRADTVKHLGPPHIGGA